MPTVLHRLARWAETDPQATAQRVKRGGKWEPVTSKEYLDQVYRLAVFLEARGFGPQDVGCILSPNNPSWVYLDLGILLLGARSAGLYPNSTGKDILYILNHTETRLLGVKDREFFDKIRDESGTPALPPAVKLILVFEGDASFHPAAIPLSQALEEGRQLIESGKAKPLAKYLAAIDAKAGAFMIYTSGTTGAPKGALLSHDNLTYTSDLAARYWKLPMARGSMFSFLPLCHIAEKLQSIGVGISQRYTVNFCTRFELVAAELPEVQPSLLLCVPRLWEKMMEGVLAKVDAGKGVKKKLAQWALAVGERVAAAKYGQRTPNPLDLLQLRLADKLVLSKIRHALGLGQAEILASGAAALPPHVSRWFRSLGLEILEDFGQTESTGVICMTEPGVESAGTVGKPVPGVEFRIADDGEILTRGRHVFVGYYKEEASTAQALEGGWLHTGDLGTVNERGQVVVRGRKKELLKTSGGKYVAPLPLEEQLKAAPEISQVCLVGDNRKFVCALITLSEAKLAEMKAKPGALQGDVVKDPELLVAIRGHVDALNRKLASYEQVKQFAVLSREFSIPDGELTPTMKMKRAVIEQRFKPVIDQMYA
jgi:long-chain acyl-CoA synthetase